MKNLGRREKRQQEGVDEKLEEMAKERKKKGETPKGKERK